MAEHFYTYGDDSIQHVEEAQSAIVTALDLLIEEMRKYMQIYDEILASEEGDEGLAFDKACHDQVSEFHAKHFPDSPPVKWVESDPEIAKQRKRDANTAQLGGMEKRLRQLLQWREIFSTTEPEQVSRSRVNKIYRIFKQQIMRHVMELSAELSSRITLDSHEHLRAYSAAVRACGCLDESWDDEEMYPFIDAKF
jgi:hypothetical protein